MRETGESMCVCVCFSRIPIVQGHFMAKREMLPHEDESALIKKVEKKRLK